VSTETELTAWIISLWALWFSFSIVKEAQKGKDSDFFVDPKFRKKK
jgi:hypothetical protein